MLLSKGSAVIKLIIIILVVAISYFFIAGRKENNEGNITETILRMDVIKNACGMYRMNAKEYPMKVEDLIKDPCNGVYSEFKEPNKWLQGETKWEGPYIDVTEKKEFLDAWGNEFKFFYYKESAKFGIIIASAGPDGKFQILDGKSGDDIVKYIRYDGSADCSSTSLVNGGTYTPLATINGIEIK